MLNVKFIKNIITLGLAVLLSTATATAEAVDQTTAKHLTILIDPGHDYKTLGATSWNGTPEHKYNMRIAKEFKEKLEQQGYRTIMTHGDSETSTLKERTEFDNYDLFISLHHDSIDPEYCLYGHKWCTTYSAYGYSLWVSPENSHYKESLKLAQLIGQRLTDDHFIHSVHHVMVTKREVLNDKTGVFSFPLCYVLRHNKKPAILVEFAVITNPIDEKNANDANFRSKFLDNIILGLEDYFVQARLLRSKGARQHAKR